MGIELENAADGRGVPNMELSAFVINSVIIVPIEEKATPLIKIRIKSPLKRR